MPLVPVVCTHVAETPVRILVVEDEAKVARALQERLEGEHYQVAVAGTGEEGFFLANARQFDLVVLGLMLPGRDGIEVLTALRRRGSQTPVLVLTARDAAEDRVLGLDSGADDYLVKPFAFPELLARIRAPLRRGRPDHVLRLKAGDLEMDLVPRTVTRGSRTSRGPSRKDRTEVENMNTVRIAIRWKAVCTVIVLVLGTIYGCTVAPKHVIWRADAPRIGPVTRSSNTQGGSLLVETEESASASGDDRVTRDPFYVYSCPRESSDCRLLDTYSNDIMTPIALPAGDYIVVAHTRGQFRQVQVRIEDGRATVVGLSDLTHGVTP